MRAGGLRHLATIENLVKGQDAAGGRMETWVEFTKAWCGIKPLSGKEKYYSAEKHATATHQITMRYISGINPKMRIVARGRVFEIVSVINDNERDRMLQIIAKEEADRD